MLAGASDHARGVLIAATGVFVLSFDALLIRLADAPIADVVFWRGWLIAASMSALWWGVGRRPGYRGRQLVLIGLLSATLYGIAAALFVVSVSLTRVANTVVILASSPLFAALWSWFFLGERIRWQTAIAITAAMLGVLVVFGGSVGGGTLVGDGLALVLAMLAAGALTLLRPWPELDRILITAGSGAVAGLLVVPFSDPLSLTPMSYGWLALMGLVQMPMAMVCTTTATRYLSSPEVSLFLLVETVLAPVWVWLAVGEEPPSWTLYGGGLVLATVAGHAWWSLRRVGPNQALARSGEV
jgi:drug/metabolite transporter (DMT)-like permease